MDQNIPHTPEKERFDKIYTATFDQLFHFIKKNIPDKSGIKDAMQECYIRLWENLGDIRDDEKVIVLLRKYAINIIINALQKRQNELQRNHSFYLEQSPVTHSDESLHARELLQKYRDALETLPPKRRKVFILKREQGLSHKQISDQLGISIFTIDRHMNEAIRTLREKLSVEMLTLIFVLLELQTLIERYCL